MLDLRATMSLARLLRRGAKARCTRERLTELLGSFTEGFDTADLREASELVAN